MGARGGGGVDSDFREGKRDGLPKARNPKSYSLIPNSERKRSSFNSIFGEEEIAFMLASLSVTLQFVVCCFFFFFP